MKISIIIPTLNEAETLPALLTNPELQGSDVELILSDGRSNDGTLSIAEENGLRIVTGAPGRGGQLQRGAAQAQGDVILFLHADTKLAPGSLVAIRHALKNEAVIGGNFRLLFDGGDDFSEWLNGFYSRIRARGLYYGDSAIFLRRHVYETLGGIRPIALMEDYDLTKRMEKFGKTVCIEDPAALTSSRRFRNRKPWRIFSQWLLMHGLYAIGAPPSLLAQFYRSKTHAPGDAASELKHHPQVCDRRPSV